jgi:hypothetical protein
MRALVRSSGKIKFGLNADVHTFSFALRHSHALSLRLALALSFSLAFLSRLFFVDPGLPGKRQPGL